MLKKEFKRKDVQRARNLLTGKTGASTGTQIGYNKKTEDYKEGDAMISQKHCNFFVNNGNAKSSDIENLIKKVKKRVYEKTGVNLELEIKIIGE